MELKVLTDLDMCAVVGYAAVHFGHAHVDRSLLIKAFASYTLLNALVNLVTRRGFGEKVGCCAQFIESTTTHLHLLL